jgi:hypothetical protein
MRRGLTKLVDGEYYFDTLDDDVLFEFRYDFQSWPRAAYPGSTLMEFG